jgi:cellulose synthase/poly-beta-1,6-N-acetylglucosamine synthase-like glycosyltransferase
MVRKSFLKYDRQIQRFLEIMPGFISWNLILFPLWAVFVIPLVVAYFVLLFDVFWFYKSITIAFTGAISHLRIKASQKLNWLAEVKLFPDWQKVQHLIIIPTANEPLHILERTLQGIFKQTFPKEQLSVVLAFEARKGGWPRKAAFLKKKYQKKFGDLLCTAHRLKNGETVGKHSNSRYAIKVAKQKLVPHYDPAYLIVTSCDADHLFHPQHFACLTFKFLDNPERYLKFWQPALMFYNNFWRLPAITRVINTLCTVWNTALLTRTDRLISCQNYSLSFRLLDRVGGWDPDVIPEDYHIFFKAFFKNKGKVEVEPIFLPLWADAAESNSFLGTLKNQYQQLKRWAWGVSDDPYVIKNYLLTPQVPFWSKTIRVLRVLEDHILWPVNWFIITLGVTIPSLLNPNFSRTLIGYSLPRLSSFILSLCLVFLLAILVIDAKQRPPRPAGVPRLRALLLPLEFVLMPLAGFFFTALPGLDAHTRLMLGKYLEYKVTEKV